MLDVDDRVELHLKIMSQIGEADVVAYELISIYPNDAEQSTKLLQTWIRKLLQHLLS